MKNTTLRGKILEFLKHIYPEGVDERTIMQTFYDYHRSTAIEQSLAYLADKELLILKELPHPYKAGERVRLYKIAPAGIDLLDGTTVDPGIPVLPEEV